MSMEIVEEVEPLWLSNYEALQHLSEQKERRGNKRTAQSVLTIEFECLEYLSACPSASLTEDKLKGLLGHLSGLKVTKLERLMLCNALPSTAVEFHAIVEECEERFGQDEIESVLDFIKRNVLEHAGE